jgi:hypothetical protein
MATSHNEISWNAVLITIVLLVGSLGVSSPLAAAPDEEGFKSIFNGQDLEGWDGDPKFWSVEDGAIVGQTTEENPTRGNTFIVWRLGEVDDFVLRLSYRIVGGNSGIQYRSKEHDKWVIGGYQADFEAGDTYSGILYEERGKRGIMAARGQKTVFDKDGKKTETQFADSQALQAGINKEDWNEYEVIAQGNHLIHKINGKVTSECIDEQADARASRGLLALQLHSGPPMKVEFKNIRLKRTRLADGRKKLVMIAGRRSHAYGQHAFYAGCTLLKQCLDKAVPNLLTTVYRDGWPKDPTAFDNADAICIYCDGGEGHPVNERLDEIDRLMNQQVGLACLHYAVEVPKGESGERFLDWIGGYFETHWSVNPHWTLENTVLAAEHPITRGVDLFSLNDEWYYHMRFRDGMEGVTAILTATPPASTLERPDGPHSGNPHVRAKIGEPQHLAWARERPDGGRGFGFTGGHFHWGWGHDDQRKLVLNALVWISGLDAPPGGVESATPTLETLEANQDFPVPQDFDRQALQRQLERWKRAAAE